MKKIILIAIAFCSLIGTISAQELDKSTLSPCGYTGKSEWLEYYQTHQAEFENNAARGKVTYMPITVFNVGNDDSTGFYNITNLLNAICQLNTDFVPAGIQFYLSEDIKYLRNTVQNNAKTFAESEGLYQNNITNTINCYVVTNAAGNCGFDWYGGLVLTKGCIAPGDHTWAHEMGHELSLPHTFSGWEGKKVDVTTNAPKKVGNKNVELLDGSNCSNSGDGFCDTPADYISDRWTCNGLKKSYTMKDPTGATFEADGRFYMSYSNDACMDRFSPLQMQAMLANANSQKGAYQDPNLVIQPAVSQAVKYISPIDTAVVSPTNVTIKWDAVPDAKYYYVLVSRLPGFDITTVRQVVTGTSITIPKLDAGKKYYWKVKPYNDFNACAPFSTKQIFVTASISAAQDISEFESISIFPTVLDEVKTIQIKIDAKQAMSIKANLVNVNGQVLKTENWQVVAGLQNFTIDANQLPKGFYILNLQYEGKNYNQKLIVQ